MAVLNLSHTGQLAWAAVEKRVSSSAEKPGVYPGDSQLGRLSRGSHGRASNQECTDAT